MDIVGNRTLRDLLTERENRYGDKTFVVFADRRGETTEFSYRDFVAGVRRTAAGLAAHGIGAGDKVVVHLANCPEFLFTWFGLGWIGAVAVPSNTAGTADEMRHVITLSEAMGIVTSAEYVPLLTAVADGVPAVRLRFVVGAEAAAEGWSSFADLTQHGENPATEPVGPEDTVELLFTSGTTSRPKAVMLTHANCLFAGERESRMLGIGPSDRCLSALPLFHVNAQTTTVLSALTAGATCILLAEYSASRFWTQVRELQATALTLVAMQLRTLLAQPQSADDRIHAVRLVLYAINVLDEEKDEFERRYGVELVNGYGLSEAMTIVTVAPVNGEKRWPSIGLPAIDRRVRLVDGDGRDVPPGGIGEIVVAGVPGRTLMRGYYRDPEATAEALRGGQLHTGDNGYFDEFGYLYFFDRSKDVIKVAGENVSASEVEHVLIAHPDVAEAAVVSATHAVRDEVPVAFVVARSGSAITSEALRSYCRQHLSKFKVPAVIQLCEQLPKTSIGKIEKKLLRQQVHEWEPIQ